MTTALKRFYGRVMVGMQAHMLGKVVRAIEHIELIIPPSRVCPMTYT